MIFKEKVEHIARLARISLSLKEKEKYQKELSSILDFIEKLKKVDVSKTEPGFHPLFIENKMREDKVKDKKMNIKSQKLINSAPLKEDRFIKVKRVLEI
jgi:aspartyl/glutamyl-tRNA(Asn/Gln) amidotransferase C subunit